MKNILLIEDNPLVRELILSCLGELAVKTRAVTSAEEAISAIREEMPDLVVSDVMLPGRSGTDLIRHLRSYPSTQNLPVIAVTTLADSESETDLRGAGFTAVIPKPINPERFAAQVGRWLK
jgi:CheY-like chemotaxis protein